MFENCSLQRSSQSLETLLESGKQLGTLVEYKWETRNFRYSQQDR